ncbi:MAG: hypothetical protein FH753_12050 [Firmicutes bacterium]|nr:hypothetical protein [Bacillota bacterium]
MIIMWCPKCKSEYREGFTRCEKCNEDLVEKLKEENKKKDNKVIKDIELVYLTNVANEKEADIIEALLNSYNIKVIKKHKEAGDYLNIYMGSSNYGMDLYVSTNEYEDAKKIINEKSDINNTNNTNTTSNIEESIDRKKIFFRLFLAIIFLPGFVFFIFSIIKRML